MDSHEMSDDEIDLQALRDKVKASPSDYQAYAALISGLRDEGELEEVREVREQMHSQFPLALQQWKEWISDEKEIASSQKEKEAVLALIRRALGDYVQVDLWLELCKCAEELYCPPAQADKSKWKVDAARECYEEAVSQVGAHVARGSEVWEQYREMEARVGDSSEEGAEKIRQLYMRQLAVPLMQQAMSSYMTWERSLGKAGDENEAAMRAYKSSQAMLAPRNEHETQLERFLQSPEEHYPSPGAASAEALAAWDAYLNFEMESAKGKDIHRVKGLYERAISQCFLAPQLWASYAKFLEANDCSSDELAKMYHRALRNCPWDGSHWLGLLRSKELAGHEDVEEQVERALNSSLQSGADYIHVCLFACGYYRRVLHLGGDLSKQDKAAAKKSPLVEKIRAMFARAEKLVQTLIVVPHRQATQDGSDPSDPAGCIWELYTTWTDMEARCLGDMERARKIWARALLVKATDVQLRVACIEQEKNLGHVAKARSLFKKALVGRGKQIKEPWAVRQMCTLWTQFEQQTGTAKEMHDAHVCCTRLLAKADEADWEAQQEALRVAQKKQIRNQKSAVRMKAKKQSEQLRKVYSGEAFADEIFKNAKRSRRDSSSEDASTAAEASHGSKRLKAAAGGAVETQTSAAVAPAPAQPASVVGEKEEEEEEPPRALEDARSAFIVNLDYNTTDQELRDVFSPHGKITGILLPKDDKGRRKGFAWVEMETVEQATTAIAALNGTKVRGRPISVKVSIPLEARKNRTKGHEDDARTVFVKNLPQMSSADAVRALMTKHFKDCGEITDVRTAQDRGGYLKKICYVEFALVDGREKALKLDHSKVTLDGGVSSVLRVQPSLPLAERKRLNRENRRKNVRPERTKARARMSLVSRGAKPAKQQPGGFSNADFRAMLLKKK